MADPQLPENSGIDLRLVTKVKTSFVVALREALGHPSAPPQYHYDVDDTKRQVSIYVGWSNRIVKFPVIIVETGNSDVSISSLDGEEGYPLTDSNGIDQYIVYTGVMSIPVQITIFADTMTDRDALTELVAFYIRFVFKDLFNLQNMPYLGINANAKGEEVKDGKVRYKGDVTVTVQGGFTQQVDLSLLDYFNNINLDDIMYGTNNADLHTNNT